MVGWYPFIWNDRAEQRVLLNIGSAYP
jgi:hypothetical protein